MAQKTSFRTVNGHYLCAENEGRDPINATRRAVGAWEEFEVEQHSDKIALRAVGGRYVQAFNGGGTDDWPGVPQCVIREQPFAHELFRLVRLQDGVALQADNGRFVCAEGGGGDIVTVNRVSPGPWETFTPSGAIGKPARDGPVRRLDRAVADDHGPFFAIGATFFWALWGWRHDRDRLLRNLDFIASTVDYVRVLGQVGRPDPQDSWHDRIIDPDVDGYWDDVAGLLDAAFQRGIRTEVTLFGGASTMSRGERETFVDRWASSVRERRHQIMLLEIANEYWQNGFAADGNELRALTKRLNDQTEVLVASSAPQGIDENTRSAFTRAYSGDVANIATVHWSRNFGLDGPYRPIRQPWDYQFLRANRIPAPPAFVNNEPIGPQSSVNADDDPSRLVLGAITTGVCQGAAYCLHTGAGIRGGGQADLDRGRAADFVDVPNIAATLAGLRWLRSLLPGDIANWDPQNWHWDAHPFRYDGRDYEDQIVRSFATLRGEQFIWVPFGTSERNRGGATFRAKSRYAITLYTPVGELLEERELQPNEAIHVDRDMIVTGTRL
jgi:hypothetical protein